MKFELNEYNRNISDEDLVRDLVLVAKKLDVSTLTRSQYKVHGRFSSNTLERRFNGWNNALIKAGLYPSRIIRRKNIDISNEDIIADIILVANELDKTSLTSTDYDNFGKYGHIFVIHRFGSWNNALTAANLNETNFHHSIGTNELLEDIERIWILLGRQPTTTDIKNGISKFSLNSYSRRFGSWRGALNAFIKYINNETDESSNQNSSDKPVNTITVNREKLGMHSTRRDVNLRLRFLVMQRDNFKCCMCGASPAKDSTIELHIDHVTPWSKGGETTMENLQTLCSKCNLGKVICDVLIII